MSAAAIARQAADRAAIAACIRRCAAAPDERGRWRAEIKCAVALQQHGNSSTALMAAEAARAIGAWLAGVTP